MQDRELEELVNGLLKDTRAPIWIMSEIDSDPNLPHEVLRMYSSKLANKYNIQMADFLAENTIKGDQ